MGNCLGPEDSYLLEISLLYSTSRNTYYTPDIKLIWYYGMPGMETNDPECQRPGCSKDWEDKYKDEHGNEVRVCGKHYYRLVTRRRSVTVTGTVNPVITPGSSSDESLYEMSKKRDIDPNMGPPEPDIQMEE